MKSEWTYRPLGELVSFASGGTPSKKRDDYWGGTIPWISAKTLKTENIDTSDFTQWKSVALFLIFFLTLGFLCVKHETFTVNIVLEVFGYQFYRCDLEDEDGNGITWMIISRTDLKGCVGDSVYLRPLNNECRLNASTR